MKPLFLILLLSGCQAASGQTNWELVYQMCSPDGVAYWRSTGSLTPRLDKDGKVIPCQP